MACRTPDLPPQLPTTALDRHSAARTEISVARILRLGSREYVGRCNRAIHARPVWHDRRRPDAELFPLSRRDRRDRTCGVRTCVGARSEFLVPLPLSLRSAARDRFFLQPTAHPALGRSLYRLREMREGLSVGVAGGQTGGNQIRGMHRM